MTTLTEFLLARIAEDEVVAKAALVEDERGGYFGGTAAQALLGLAESEGAQAVAVAHFARHDPARVLAECEAKRRIVEEHGANEFRVDPCDAHDANFETIPCDTLRYLAAVYADHPDYYREGWKP